MAAGRRVAPDGGVVDAGEVRGEVDLLARHGIVLLRRRRSGWRGGAGRAARAGCRPRRPVRKAPRRCSSGTRPRVICVQVVRGASPGRSRSPLRPAACHSSARSASSAGRADEDPRVADVARARAARRAAPCGPRPRRRTRRGTPRRRRARARSRRRGPRRPARRGPSPRIAAASAASRGVTNPRSADRPTSRNATSRCASAATTGWPCGGRGVIDGPRTEKCAPSKSM